MTSEDEYIKENTDLLPSDFKEHPIWGWEDEDGGSSLVIPVDESELTAGIDWKHDILFILSEFILSDGTKLTGSIGVVLSDKRVYLLEFFKGNESYSFSLNSVIREVQPMGDLVRWLMKPSKQIFPLIYTTKFCFEDGTPIAGAINLEKDII